MDESDVELGPECFASCPQAVQVKVATGRAFEVDELDENDRCGRWCLWDAMCQETPPLPIKVEGPTRAAEYYGTVSREEFATYHRSRNKDGCDGESSG